MEKTAFIVLLASALAFPVAGWEMNPLSWTHDAEFRVLRTDGSSPFAVADAPLAEDIRVEAEVRPEGAGTNGWATLGVAVHGDDRNFWHVALVRSPPEEGAERHTFELCEMREGVWLSQGIDKLKCLRRVHKGAWKYGEAYRMSLRIDRAAREIAGEIRRGSRRGASRSAREGRVSRAADRRFIQPAPSAVRSSLRSFRLIFQ